MHRHLGLYRRGPAPDSTTRSSRRGSCRSGKPEIDELIGIYNRMVDRLRDERVRARRAAPVPGRVLHGLAVGHRHSRLRRPGQQPQPGGRAAAGCRPGVHGRARRLESLGSPLADGAGGPRAGRCAARRHARGPARSSATTATFIDRGFPRSFFVDRGADRRAAPVRARGLREADPRDVPRGEQHRRRLELAAALVARLRRRAGAGQP